MKSSIILAIAVSTVFSSMADAGLKIYYIRHAEGGHNVKEAWEEKGVPEAEWPTYVGKPDMFTPQGLEEVVSGTEKLMKYDFDFIASSTLWRAWNTILPYLKAKGKTAEVWPELKEGPGMRTILSNDLPEVKEGFLNKGEPLEIPEDEAKRGLDNTGIGWWSNRRTALINCRSTATNPTRRSKTELKKEVGSRLSAFCLRGWSSRI